MPGASFAIGNCKHVQDYEIKAEIGEGSYGSVYEAEERATRRRVALKRIKIDKKYDKEGVPQSALREIQVLRLMRHENVVRLLDVAVAEAADSLHLVFELCEHDLANLIDKHGAVFKEREVKAIVQQVLSGVRELQRSFVMHRDLKLSNLLYTNDGLVKICDFGLARMYGDPPKSYTPGVLTLWYRPPELILSETRYTTAADMWSVGCIAGELLAGAPLAPGAHELAQLQHIFTLLGTPDKEAAAYLAGLPGAALVGSVKDTGDETLSQAFAAFSPSAVSFLRSLLAYLPASRLTVGEALHHPYFDELPFPVRPSLMPKFAPSSKRSAARAGLPKVGKLDKKARKK
ncbi:hypothetical protein DIPPA_17080 [Diplonema papillatum]|nr:hypothetical protein DIPPA_17080 [Diplonema papillatum]